MIRHDADDPLARAVRALRDPTREDGPPAEVIEATVESLRSASFVLPMSTSPAIERRRFMFRSLGISGAAAMLVAAGLAAWLGPAGRSAASFAEVLDRVKQARNVRFVQHQKLTPTSPELPLRTAIEGSRFRMELDEQMILVADVEAKKAIQISPGSRTYAWLPFNAGTLDRVLANPLEQILSLRPDDARPSGREEVDGRPADVYQLSRFRFLGFDTATAKPEDALKLTLWADVETHLPVKIEFSFDSGPAGRPNTSVIRMEDFEWNVEIPREELAVEAPAGYRETSPPGPGPVDAPKPPGSDEDGR
jgi:outer membrane lipoprotein-sorting protein